MKKMIRITFEGKSYDVEVEVLNGAVAPAAVAQTAPVAAVAAPAVAQAPVAPAPAAGAGTPVPSPMMGLVFKMKVKVGDTVAANQEIVVLEAMKMENDIVAPCDGTVKEIVVTKGTTVNTDDVLAII